MNAPFSAKLLNNFFVRCLPLAQLFAWRDLSALQARAEMQGEPESSVQALLYLVRAESHKEGLLSAGAEPGQTHFSTEITPRLQNPYGIAHGGAIAGLLLTAARQHLALIYGPGTLKDFSTTYLSMVPGD